MVLLHGTELSIAADASVDWDEGFLWGLVVRASGTAWMSKRANLKTLALNLCTAHPELADDG